MEKYRRVCRENENYSNMSKNRLPAETPNLFIEI
jgi:hypothetical protein